MTTKDNAVSEELLPYPTVDSAVEMEVDNILISRGDMLDLDSIHPGLSRAVIATAVQGVNSKVKNYLDPYMTTAGTPKGRSLTDTRDEGEAAPVNEADAYFIRPNGQKYFHRAWGDQHKDVDVLRKARAALQCIFLYGPPGTGKTALSEAAFGEELITVLGTGDTELSDFVGGYVPMPDGTYQWIDGPLVRAAEEGRPLLIDEIGVIDAKVLTGVYGLMDGRRELTVTANPSRGTVKAKDGFFVIAATNPNAPGVRLSEAMLSRFALQAEITTDYALARRLGVEEKVVRTASAMDKNVRSGGGASWAPQFRELLVYRDVAQAFGVKFAIENLIASAPESDRESVAEQFSKNLGKVYLPARI